MTGILQIRVSKAGLRVYPEVYIVAIDVYGSAVLGDLVPYGEDRLYELGAGLYTIKAENDLTGEVQEKDVEIYEAQTIPVSFTFGIVPTVAPNMANLVSIFGSLTVGVLGILGGFSK